MGCDEGAVIDSSRCKRARKSLAVSKSPELPAKWGFEAKWRDAAIALASSGTDLVKITRSLWYRNNYNKFGFLETHKKSCSTALPRSGGFLPCLRGCKNASINHKSSSPPVYRSNFPPLQIYRVKDSVENRMHLANMLKSRRRRIEREQGRYTGGRRSLVDVLSTVLKSAIAASSSVSILVLVASRVNITVGGSNDFIASESRRQILFREIRYLIRYIRNQTYLWIYVECSANMKDSQRRRLQK